MLPKVSFVCIAVLLWLATPASAGDAVKNFQSFEGYVQRLLEQVESAITVEVRQSETHQGVHAQTECRGATGSVTCVVTVSDAIIADVSDSYIEFMAAHEVCHITLAHYTLPVEDFIRRPEEIELEADKCVATRMEEEAFVDVMAERFYLSQDPGRTIPRDALERAIIKVYIKEEESGACTKEQAAAASSSVVALERIFAPDERYLNNGAVIEGVRGTGWRLGEREIATVAHVALGLQLNDTEWKLVTVSVSDAEYSAPSTVLQANARLKYVAETVDSEEAIAVIELDAPLPESVTLGVIRYAPLQQDEEVVGVGYSGNVLRFATGTLNFPKHDPTADQSPHQTDLLPFELVDEGRGEAGDRLALDYGSSGAPIFDCKGHVVALVAFVITQELSSFGIVLSSPMRVSTPWGMPNVLGLPASYVPN